MYPPKLSHNVLSNHINDDNDWMKLTKIVKLRDTWTDNEDGKAVTVQYNDSVDGSFLQKQQHTGQRKTIIAIKVAENTLHKLCSIH